MSRAFFIAKDEFPIAENVNGCGIILFQKYGLLKIFNAMNENKELVDILNDLIKINNDRIAGYEKAIEDAKDIDIDLKMVFQRMIQESQQCLAELTTEVIRLGGEPTTSTTTSGKVYRAWIDIKVALSGSDRKALLNACEFGEDAAQEAYSNALSSDAEIPAEVRQLIIAQKSTLKASHDIIRKYRDIYSKVSS
jgi:uncharacterized protein (TIGR02284 family)